MSKSKIKQKKKKDREKRVKEKVLKRRSEIRAKAKFEREIMKLEIEDQGKVEPFVEPLNQMDKDIKIAKNDIIEAKAMNSSEKVIKALEHNLEILRGLKEEYLVEKENKEKLNERLESLGCKTLQEKIDYLNKEQNITKVSDLNVKKKRKPLHLRKETAECEVIKSTENKD